MLGSTAFSWQLSRALKLSAVLGQEVHHRHCIEIEHLRACQPAIAEAIQPKHLFIYAFPVPLAPRATGLQHHRPERQ